MGLPDDSKGTLHFVEMVDSDSATWIRSLESIADAIYHLADAITESRLHYDNSPLRIEIQNEEE